MAVAWGGPGGAHFCFSCYPQALLSGVDLSFMIQTNVCPFPPEITNTQNETMYGVQILCLVKNVVWATKKVKYHSLDITVNLTSQP